MPFLFIINYLPKVISRRYAYYIYFCFTFPIGIVYALCLCEPTINVKKHKWHCISIALSNLYIK